MQEIYGTNVTSDTVMRRVDLVPYMQEYDFLTIQSAAYPSITNVRSMIAYEILGSRPVILNMYNENYNEDADTDDQHSNHAIVAVGYDDVYRTVTIWNPWYPYLEEVLDLAHYVPLEHRSYEFNPVEYWYNNCR